MIKNRHNEKLLAIAASKLREAEQTARIVREIEDEPRAEDWREAVLAELAEIVRASGRCAGGLARKLADAILDDDSDAVLRLIDDLANSEAETLATLREIKAAVEFETALAAVARIVAKLATLKRQRSVPPDVLAFSAQVESEAVAVLEHLDDDGEISRDNFDTLVERLELAVDLVCECPVATGGDR